MKDLIYIRADGDVQIGLGHLVRCIALAQMLGKDFEIVFVAKKIPETTVKEIKQLGFALIEINSEAEFLNQLNNKALVVLDHYNLGADYQLEIKKRGSRLVCIDDLHDKTFYADLIINHAPNIETQNYQAQVYTQFALGLDYVLLRPVFLNNTPTPKFNKIETAFVCFGGSDGKNITQLVADLLKEDNRFKHIHIVVGPAYQHITDLKESLKHDDRFHISQSVGAETMFQLISNTDLAIVPASGILQEVLSSGVRVISGMYVENQKNIFEKYKALGAFESAEDFSISNLRTAISTVFKTNGNYESLIDGNSGKRLLKIFKQLFLEHRVDLRTALESDVNITFNWCTNKKIREFSFNKNEIEFNEHSDWFISKIKNTLCCYYVAELDQKAVGSVRFDIEGERAIVSYLVDPDYHNLGLGIVLLKKAIQQFMNDSPSKIKQIEGHVMKQNIASIKIFERLNFQKVNDGQNYCYILKTNK